MNLEGYIRKLYNEGELSYLPSNYSEDQAVEHCLKVDKEYMTIQFNKYMKKADESIAEEYSEMKGVFGRMADAFKDIADQVEEKNRVKAAKKAKAAEVAKRKYYSIFTKEEIALLSSASQAKATGDKPETHNKQLSEHFIKPVEPKEESDKEKEWNARKTKEQGRMLTGEYGKERANLLKRSRGKTIDLTLGSGTRNLGDRNRAEVGSGLRGNVTAANIGIQRENFGRLRAAVNREAETEDRVRAIQSIRINAEVLGRKICNTPWTKLSAEELEQAKELFGDKLPEILRLNEKKFGPF